MSGRRGLIPWDVAVFQRSRAILHPKNIPLRLLLPMDSNMDGPSPASKTPTKRGLGKGGKAAHYCTMSAAARCAQFPSDPLVVRLNDSGIESLWC